MEQQGHNKCMSFAVLVCQSDSGHTHCPLQHPVHLPTLAGCLPAGGKGFGDPVTFDNAYYTALLQKPWLNPNDNMASMIGLPSDHVLPDDAECLQNIQAYAADQQAFFRDFTAAYRQLTSLGVSWA